MKEKNRVGDARLHRQLEGILAKHGIRLKSKEGVATMAEHVFGTALTENDFQMFAGSGIRRELAERAARRVDSQTGAEMFGCNGFSGNFAGLIFEYRWSGGDRAREYVLRLDEPRLEMKADGSFKEKNKYLWPTGGKNLLYVPPGTLEKWLEDSSLPIIIVEGIKKALATQHLGWHGVSDAAERPQWLAIALSGVWNWRGVVGKIDDANGKRRDVKGVIPDFGRRIDWDSRQVVILFDSNVNNNDNVRIARFTLAKELREERGANVLFADLPGDLKVNGIDDVAGQIGPEKAMAIIAGAYDPKNKKKKGSTAVVEAPISFELGEKPKGDDHEIAQDLFDLMKEYIVFPDDGPLYILAVYILHTHSAEAFYYTPYIHVCSAEKKSGKSRVQNVLPPLVRKALKTENISGASLARVVELKGRPTLLIDEVDTMLGPKANGETAETIRGILNSGYEKAGTYIRQVGAGANQETHEFATFCPKVLAGLGSLPETTASRSIPLRIRRAKRGETKRFRPGGMSKASKELDERLNKLRKRAAWWAKQHLENVADCEPDFPAEFDERQCDNSEALLAIAHVLGDPWPERIKAALRNVFSSIAADDSSTGVLLLGHIRKIFFDKDEVRLYTKDLIDALYAIPEAPWKHWNNGKDRTPGLTDRALAKMLKEYEVESTTVRIPRVKPLKGYKLEDFNDTFQRLLPPVCKCRIGDWECDCHEACKGDCSPPESNARDEGTARKAVN